MQDKLGLQYRITEKTNNYIKVFKSISEIKGKAKYSFGDLDNFLWLTGKLLKNSFSGILDKKQYKDLKNMKGHGKLRRKIINYNETDVYILKLKRFILKLESAGILNF